MNIKSIIEMLKGKNIIKYERVKTLYKVLNVPRLYQNLISMSKMSNVVE